MVGIISGKSLTHIFQALVIMNSHFQLTLNSVIREVDQDDQYACKYTAICLSFSSVLYRKLLCLQFCDKPVCPAALCRNHR